MTTEVKVAVISAVGVILAGVATAYFTGVFTPDPKPVDGDDPNPRPRQEVVDVTIRDALTNVQYSEALNIEIDGESKGDLSIESTTRPEAEMTVTLEPGGHNYEIQGNTRALATDGTVQVYPVEGKGQIEVLKEDTQSFDIIKVSNTGGVFVVRLEPSS